MIITFFPSRAATSMSWQEYNPAYLADRIEAEVAPAKDRLPMLKLARFGNELSEHASYRHDPNVIAVTGCEVDYDGGQHSPEWAAARLGAFNIEALIYTSPSHTEDVPRWRVLCPFSVEREPGWRGRMVSRLNWVLGGEVSSETWALSTAYYYGRAGAKVRVIRVEGHRLDLCEGLMELGKRREDRAHTARTHSQINPGCVEEEGGQKEEWLSGEQRRYATRMCKNAGDQLFAAPVGERNNRLTAVAFTVGTIAWTGVPQEMGTLRCLTLIARHIGLGDEEIARAIRNGFAAGQKCSNRLDHLEVYRPKRIDQLIPT